MIFTPLTKPVATVALDAMNQRLVRGNEVVQLIAEETAIGLANIWNPSVGTPADMLAALGTTAAAAFAQHGAFVAMLWSDASRRAVFLASCQRHGVAVSAGQDGTPAFGQMRSFTGHEDGTITLN